MITKSYLTHCVTIFMTCLFLLALPEELCYLIKFL